MADSSLPKALDRLFEDEGGYVDHPSDPGGATNMGITHRTLAAWRGVAVTKADVRSLTRTEAAAIYRERYWRRVGADALPAGIDYCVFDAAVHSGPSRAVRWLQTELRTAPDGIVGPKTLAAAARTPRAALVSAYCRRRLGFMRGLRTWPTFGRGWSRRVARVERAALELVREDRSISHNKEDAMQQTKRWYESKTVWGAIVTLLTLAANAFGLAIGAEEQAALLELAPQLIGIGGALVALFGRLSARAVID